MSVRFVLVSDAHARGPDDPVQRDLVAFIERVEADGLVLLGDLFDHWWGFEHGVMEPYRPVVEALERKVRAGLRLWVVGGNHDFRLGPVFRDRLDADVGQDGEARTVVLDGRRVAIAHGDEGDTRPGYRLTRRALRGRTFDRTLQALGPVGAWGLLRRLSGTSRAYGGPPTELLRLQAEDALRRLASGAELVISGHSHVPAIHELPGGLWVNAGDFVQHRSHVVLEDGEPRLLVERPDAR